MPRIPIVTETLNGKQVKFHNLNDKELKIYRELQYLKELVPLQTLKDRFPKNSSFDRSIKKLNRLKFISIIDASAFGDEPIMVMANS